MQDHQDNPSMARGVYRIAVLLGCVALVSYFLWETFSTTAAVGRLSAAARNFPYVDRCDAEGNRADKGQPNCVDLGRYVFINGPVLQALRRPCSKGDGPSVMLTLAEGEASREDIAHVEKSLTYRKRFGRNGPCFPPTATP